MLYFGEENPMSQMRFLSKLWHAVLKWENGMKDESQRALSISFLHYFSCVTLPSSCSSILGLHNKTCSKTQVFWVLSKEGSVLQPKSWYTVPILLEQIVS